MGPNLSIDKIRKNNWHFIENKWYLKPQKYIPHLNHYSSTSSNYLPMSQHNPKEKKTNNTMPIVIIFIANANSKIPIMNNEN